VDGEGLDSRVVVRKSGLGIKKLAFAMKRLRVDALRMVRDSRAGTG
jgi:hypothetical protein